MPVTLRDATLDEVDAICRLVNTAFLVELAFIEGDRTDPAEVRSLLHTGAILVAHDAGGSLRGCVYVESEPPTGRFGLLSVDPAHQGAGLGRRLVAAAEERCRARGCREVEIRVVDQRAELPPFYRRLGYRETGEVVPFPEEAVPLLKKPCRFIVMRKPLADR